ncbi:MAG: hypothetical protein QM796_13340 [Chthoniobacteraceae bacterium]
MKLPITLALTFFALLAATRADVTIELAGGYLKNSSGSLITNGSGLLLLVASTSDSTFTTPTTSSSLTVGSAISSGSDDIILYKSAISGDGNNSGTDDAGEFRMLIDLTLSSTVTEGASLILYWFPTLTTSSTSIALGTTYGSYRSSIALDESGTTDGDGSQPWYLPADGTSAYELLFLTSDAGSAINTGITGAATNLIAAPEPTSTGLILAMAALLAAPRRRPAWACVRDR